MDEKKEVIYSLLSPIKYAQGGDEVEANFLTLLSPTSKQLKNCARLKQAFFRAIKELNSNEESSEKDAQITGPDCINLLYMSSAEMDKVLLEAIELFRSGVVLVEGGPLLKDAHIKQMAHEDIEGMLGEYLANFIIASLMTQTK